MTRSELPQIPESRITFFREQLYRELSHMFIWEGLPQSIPHDYLERSLVRTGKVLFFDDELIGLDVLQAEVIGYNRHNLPTTALATVQSTDEISKQIKRTIKRQSDSDIAIDEFDPTTDGVLIYNMEGGQSVREIVDHFAYRLALAQIAFDTNLLWQNRPYIFPVDSNDSRLSLEKLFQDISSGRPFIPVDKKLFQFNPDGTVGVKMEVPFIGKELMDTRNEIMMKFHETVGITTAGVEKAERATVAETTSNVQHTKTVLQIMLEQRQIASADINAFFGLNTSVNVIGAELMEDQEEGEEDNGTGDSGTGELIEDEF